MASQIREMVDRLNRKAVTKLGEAVGLKFHRKSPRQEQVCRSYGQRFGADGAVEAAIDNLSADDLRFALEKLVYFVTRDDEEIVWEAEVKALNSLNASKVRDLAFDVFTSDDNNELADVIEKWADNFRINEHNIPSADNDDDNDDFDEGDEYDDDDDDSPNATTSGWKNIMARHRNILSISVDDLVDMLRDAQDSKIRGVTFQLPAIKPDDPQPLFIHQDRTIHSVERNGRVSGIVHLPTGAGKTRVALEIMARAMKDLNARVIWSTHSRSLTRQSMIRVVELQKRFGRKLAIRWLRDIDDATRDDLFDEVDVIYATRKTLTGWLGASSDSRRNADALRSAVTSRRGSKEYHPILLVYDECHELGADKLQSAIRKFYKNNLGSNADQKRLTVIGLSATPMPTTLNSHALLQDFVFPIRKGTKSAKADWRVLVHHSESMRGLTAEKILCPINLRLQKTGRFDIPNRLVERASGSSMGNFGRKKPAGVSEKQWATDFSMQFNRNVMTHPDVLKFLSGQIADHISVLGKTIVFCATIPAANYLVAKLQNSKKVGKGKVSLVHSRMEDPEVATMMEDTHPDQGRSEVQIKEFLDRGSEACVMVNVGMLTTGFDDPRIQSVVLARLTFSKNLFWQMIGRGLRGPTVGGTPDCNVIDPIRLTDRFEVFNGYKPDALQAGIPKQKDLESDRGAFVDPQDLAPETREVEARPGPEAPMDLNIREAVQIALRAFLSGEQYDFREVAAAIREVSIESGPEGASFVSAPGGASDGSMVAILEGGIQSYEDRMGSPMPWIYRLLPPTTDRAAQEEFIAKFSVIESKEIVREEDWHSFATSVWTRQL
jgi:superfamily II DNA or RNA helicase